MRRSQKQLETVVKNAKSQQGEALAYYDLGVFHDNNSREAEATPYYLKALKLGLDVNTRAKALAYLSSSLYKTGNFQEALKRCLQSLRISKDKKLTDFLIGLEKRIARNIESKFKK